MGNNAVHRAQILGVALMLLLLPSSMFFTSTVNSDLNADEEAFRSVHESYDFNESQGFTLKNISIDNSSGSATLNRPLVSWQNIATGGLVVQRTGACAAYVETIDEIMLIGGRIDPDPTANGDETSTNFVENYALSNQTWYPNPYSMASDQLYFGCASIGDKVYTIGDFYPMATPEMQSEGIVQIFNASNQTWTQEDPMPPGTAVGLAGVDDLDGFVYVAGGVSIKNRSDTTDRFMRYNPASKAWDEMANMNVARHSFSINAFHGKLYAIGGQTTVYNSTSDSVETTTLNSTEVYDPSTDSWTLLSNLSFSIAAYASAVHNDEILISGGISTHGFVSPSNDVYGYNPLTGYMSTHSQLASYMFDHTLTSTNGSLLVASGDSSNYRFSTWSTNYLDVSEFFVNPAYQDGWISSDTVDLRKGTQGATSPVWLSFDGHQSANTSVELQYKFEDNPLALSNAAWRPLGIQNSSDFFSIGNHSLVQVENEQSFMQYRIRLNTTELNLWEIPELYNVKVYSEEATILSQIPTALHPNAAPIEITTFHSSYSTESSYSLQISATDEDGFVNQGSQPAVLVWNPNAQTWNISDPDGMMRTNDVDVQLQSSVSDGDSMVWSLAIDEALTSEYLSIQITTNGLRVTNFSSPNIMKVENILDVNVVGYEANFSSSGDSQLESFEVVPAGTSIELHIDHRFNSTGTDLLYGLLEARIHLDIEQPGGGWFNDSGEWFELDTGQITTANYLVENDSSGVGRLWIEARTQDNFVLNVLPSSKYIVVNVDNPIQVSTTPQTGDYTNEESMRNVKFVFFDVGGFSQQTVSAHVWIEALHDADADALPSIQEYEQYQLYVSNIDNEWTLNLTVNDTANDDHQMVHVRLDGSDLSGKNIRPTEMSTNGHLWWESRTSELSTLVSIEPLFETFLENRQRIEPTSTFGWEVVVADTNSLSDISEVRIELGGDESLGIRYNVNLNTCEAIDGRILVQSSCQSTVTNSTLKIEFIGQADWSWTNSALEDGLLSVVIRDYDGLSVNDRDAMWSLERQMSIELRHLADSEGSVQGDLEAGWTIISGETVSLNATVHHLLSNTAYDGQVSVFWRGKVQTERFNGGATVDVVNGTLETELSAPSGAGLWHETTLEIWDPYNSVLLYSMDLPNMFIDASAPRILPSTLTTGISRYHLDHVEIGVNIDETSGWSSNLTLNCQIQSLDFKWPVLTLSREPSTVFDGKTMFSFIYDFSDQGDPSTLSTQASIACWAEGSDDAGWALTASQGNSPTNPWLTSTLNNVGPDISIDAVNFEGSFEPDSTLRMSIRVMSSGEQIEQPFNITISIVQGEDKTIAARESIPEISANSALNVRSSLTVPQGSWTLLVEVDAEGELWELDEVNNVWSENYSASQDEFSSTTVIVAGGGGFLLATGGIMFILKKRQQSPISEPSTPLTGPQKRSSPKKKPTGLKGPPPKKADAALPTSVPQSSELHTPLMNQPIGTTVRDYSKLPGGGEYHYVGPTTYYVGDGCGHWMLNEDQSFTRIDPASMA